MGYDVADYKQIDPRYGSIEDVDELIAELKKRDMRLMMDLVVNHTSDQVLSNLLLANTYKIQLTSASMPGFSSPVHL